MMARFGYEVVAADPDRAALDNARRRPHFDPGRIDGSIGVVGAVAEHLPFADRSFDGALAFHVMHHVDDLRRAVAEVARVLKPGARAVFCEPGLDHQLAPETQRAMTEHGENDKPFDVLAFLQLALHSGFSEALLPATLQSPLTLVPSHEVELYRSGRHTRAALTPAGVVDELHRHHAFALLVREGVRAKDSRRPGVLRGDLQVRGMRESVAAGAEMHLQVRAHNVGDTLWLSAPSHLGGFVTLGCKLLGADGRLIDALLGRTLLPADVNPGAAIDVTMRVRLPATLPPATYTLAVDLIDELVCWFSDLDPSRASRHAIEVVT
jgi:SAM-dependent methyltransferase